MQQHVDDHAVFILSLGFNRDSLQDGCFSFDLALKFEAAVVIDSPNENGSQESSYITPCQESQLQAAGQAMPVLLSSAREIRFDHLVAFCIRCCETR